MTIFELLKTGHNHLKMLLEKLKVTDVQDTNMRQMLFKKLRNDLESYTESKEKFIYEALKNKKSSRELALVELEESHILQNLLKEMSELFPGDEVWTAKLKVLTEVFLRHMEKEEKILFQKLRTCCTKPELSGMFFEMTIFKKNRVKIAPSIQRYQESVNL